MDLFSISLLVAMFMILVGVIVGLYTRAGSGISQHPWGTRRSMMAPDAVGHDEISGRDEREHVDVSRGTR